MAIEITRCNTIRVRLNTNHIRITIPAVVTDSGSGIPALAAYYDDNITPAQYDDLTYAEYEA